MEEEACDGVPLRPYQLEAFHDYFLVDKLDKELELVARSSVLQRYASLGVGVGVNRQQLAYNGFRQTFQDHAICEYCSLVIGKTEDRLWKRSLPELHHSLSKECPYAMGINSSILAVQI